jgi:hypothetical protein
MSKNIIIYQTDYITVEYVPDKKFIQHVIHKPMSGQVEMLKEALNAGTEAMIKYKVTKWLSDDRKNDALAPETAEWGHTDWHPRTLAAGWKYWANVIPTDVEAAGTLAPVIESLYALGLRMQVFTSVEQAVAWLDSLPE